MMPRQQHLANSYNSGNPAKAAVRKARSERQTEEAKKVYDQLQPAARRLLDCASEKGASSWISTLPIEEHGFASARLPLGMPSACATAGPYKT